MAESSIKRVFAKGDMPLSRIDEVLRVLKMDFAELARKIADAQPLRRELTHEQEAAVIADRKLLLMAICAFSQWTFEQIVATYDFSDAECVKYLVQLDRLGIIELRPLNRYRLKVAKGFRWRPNGPVMQYFREHVADDYFSGGFDGEGEMLMLVHGQIGRSLAATFAERLQRIGQDFAQQHLADQKLQRRSEAPLHAGGGHALLVVRGLPRPQARGRLSRPSTASVSSPSVGARRVIAPGVRLSLGTMPGTSSDRPSAVVTRSIMPRAR